MGPDQDMPGEAQCQCVQDCGEMDNEGTYQCSGDDQRGERCSGCDHERKGAEKSDGETAVGDARVGLDALIETANRRVYATGGQISAGTVREGSLIAAGGWAAPSRTLYEMASPPPYQLHSDWTAPQPQRPRSQQNRNVEDRIKAVEAAQKALRTNRGIGLTEPGDAEQIMRLAQFILTGETTDVDVAVRG